MRYYPTADANFYIEDLPLWERCERTPNKSWRREEEPKHTICVWRDVKELPNYTQPYTMPPRLKPDARLRVLHGVGTSFIRLQKAFPVGYKFAPQPMSLAEVRAIQDHEKQLEIELRRLKRENRRLQKEIEAENKLKQKKFGPNPKRE